MSDRLRITQKGVSIIERMALDPTYRYPGLGTLTEPERQRVLDIMWRRDWYHRGEQQGWWE